MRSRYSAFALGLIDYLIDTASHPGSQKDLEAFAQETEFIGLEILEFVDGEETAFVTFRPHLRQKGCDFTYTEKSSFEKVGGRWLYKESLVMKKE